MDLDQCREHIARARRLEIALGQLIAMVELRGGTELVLIDYVDSAAIEKYPPLESAIASPDQPDDNGVWTSMPTPEGDILVYVPHAADGVHAS